jgi:rubrerythrin
MRILPEDDACRGAGAENQHEPSVYYCPTCGYNEGNRQRCPRCGSPMGTTPFKRVITESLNGFGRREE